MNQTDWVILGVGIGLLFMLWDISAKLQQLINLVHRIRIDDRKPDF